VHVALLREVSDKIDLVRLVLLLVPLSEGLWLRDLAGGIVDLYTPPSRAQALTDLSCLGPFSGSCASAPPCAASVSFCSSRSPIRVQIAF
jgi:hypothetical protein